MFYFPIDPKKWELAIHELILIQKAESEVNHLVQSNLIALYNGIREYSFAERSFNSFSLKAPPSKELIVITYLRYSTTLVLRRRFPDAKRLLANVDKVLKEQEDLVKYRSFYH